MNAESPVLADEPGRGSTCSTLSTGPEPQRGASPPSKPPNKGRVRTGCLVCRARKVKCDEERPTCQKCARLKRSCVYRIPSGWGSPIESATLSTRDGPSDAISSGSESLLGDVSSRAGTRQYGLAGQPSPPRTVIDEGTQRASTVVNDVSLPNLPLPEPEDFHRLPSIQGASSSNQQAGHAIFDAHSERFRHTSQIIYLSTLMDWMAASQAPNASSFTYFIDVVDCPVLSYLDHINWTGIKRQIASLGLEQPPVAEMLLAVQALYRAQVDRLPMTHAMSVYQAAITTFESACSNDGMGFDIVLVITFLICLCAVTLPNEDSPHLAVLEGTFAARLEGWLSTHPEAPVSLRLCAWLQLLNSITKHPGSAGLLSPSTLQLLYDHVKEVPSLSTLDFYSFPGHCLYDAIAAPIFTFYLKLQTMSNRVTDVTHYRRSRTTPEDQAEVTELMATVKTDLARLWDTRPAPLQLQPDEVREHFSAQISGPLIALCGVCIAAFHSEVIVIGRILGDPPFPSDETKHSKEQIRSIVDGDWNVHEEDGSLNPGLVRPLFVYALESFDKSELSWVADRMREIKHPMSRSNFLASFIEVHGEAQRVQSRRVTMKYFCYQTFGVPLPFM